MTFAYLDSPRPIALAHRGGSTAGENGLAAFEAVERLGFRYIETDVRTTQDGVPFVFHDEDVRRMTGVDGSVGEMAASELERLSLPSGGSIPTLAAALEGFPRMRFNIDLKDDAAVGAVASLLGRVDALDRVCLTSFSDRRIAAARRLLGDELCTGLGVGGALAVGARSILPWGGVARPRGPAVAQVPFRWRGIRLVSRRVVNRAHADGLALHVWTLNDRAEIEAALEAGVDGVMSDRPELLKDVLVARGLWQPQG